MIRLSSRTLFSSTLSLPFSPPKHHSLTKNFSIKMTSSSSSSTVEHIVLFKVKPDTDLTKVNLMVNGLSSLISLDHVLHLTAGPVHKNRSDPYTFTHMLHSRYNTKEELANYSAHPNHLKVVRETVFPICEDLMAVDWVNEDLNGPIVPNPGSVMRLSLLKLKEGSGDSEKGEVLGVLKECLGKVDQSSVGENFSFGRDKGFSIASIAFFPNLGELEEAEKLGIVASEKEKVKEHLESVIVLDYVIPQSASL